MRYLKTSEAATLLNVTANTLRAWESRFDFPKPQRSPGNHRSYLHCEVAALRRSLSDGLSISSAVLRAREALAADGRSLTTALAEYDRERADAAIEAALGFRSVEHSVEEVLLPALEQIRCEHTVDSAAWAFAAHWGGDWLRRATRLAPPRLRRLSILLGDASRDELDLDALYIRALELFCLRAGIEVMSLSVRGVGGIRGGSRGASSRSRRAGRRTNGRRNGRKLDALSQTRSRSDADRALPPRGPLRAHAHQRHQYIAVPRE